MQFGPCLPRILQQIWEVDPKDGPVYLSKWDISDDFHRCVLIPANVGAFSYVVPPIPPDTDIYMCVDLVLPMGWVSSPPFFCAASKTAADLANAYLTYDRLPTLEYGPTLGNYSTIAYPPASAGRLKEMDVYMDNLNCLAQGSPDQHRRVTEMVLQGIKDIFPSLLFNLKDSFSLKKAQKGDGNWAVEKDILGWILN